MLEDFMKANPDPEAVRKAFSESLPLGRAGEVTDIANGILYLDSDESSWVTGAALSVDGGAIL
jgi:NAD(P)-dependent dehydrogenase (short-subunit alcohol dehydrogenase family)